MKLSDFLSSLKDPLTAAGVNLTFADDGGEAAEPKPINSRLERGSRRWEVISRFQHRDEGIEGFRLRREMLEASVRNFDPDNRQVAVIAGVDPTHPESGAGPGHFRGEWLPPMGEVIDLDMDRVNLWGHLEGLIDPETGEDRMQALIDLGWTARSIGLMMDDRDSPETSQLFHLALLPMGNQPRIPNMPRLDRQLNLSFNATLPASISTSTTGSEWAQFRIPSAPPRGHVVTFGFGQTSSADEEDLAPMTEKDFEKLGEVMDGKLSAIGQSIKEGLDGLKDALLSRASEDGEEKPEPEQAVEEPEEDDEETAEANADDEAKSAIVEEAIKSGRDPRAVRAIVAAAATPAGARAAVQTLPVILGDRIGHEVKPSGSDESVVIDPRHFNLLTKRTTVEPGALEALGRCMVRSGAHKETDKRKAFAALRREIYRASGQTMPRSESLFG